MGFKRGKLERCLFVHESNEARVVSHVDDSLTVVYLGFEYQNVFEAAQLKSTNLHDETTVCDHNTLCSESFWGNCSK